MMVPHLILLSFLLLSPSINIFMAKGQLSSIVDDEEDDTLFQTYIVHVEKPDSSDLLRDEDLESWHRSFLPNTTLSSGEPRLIYSYTHAISGFAARLSPEELIAVEAKEGVLLAVPDKEYQLATTYSPKFLNLSGSNGAWSLSSSGEGTIIGVLDTGIIPTHPSFNDDGMPSPPKKWKGKCFKKFKCNKKIIGAAVFGKEKDKKKKKKDKKDKKKKPTPLDKSGHGTHVASIAAGSFVYKANVLGTANGTACGTAPRAHLAIYKVCHSKNCTGSDVLAGMDQAIKDGCDVINLSLSGDKDEKFYKDVVAVGALSAIKKGIIPVCAAGNGGPGPGTLGHSAPWLLTVGAVSTDRKIEVDIKLGNGESCKGESGYQPDNSTFNATADIPLMFPGMYGNHDAKYCLNGSLDYVDVEGKIVLCWSGKSSNIQKGRVVFAAGGLGMVVMNEPDQGCTTSADAHVLPACNVGFMDGRKIRDYVYNCSANATLTATASLSFVGTTFGFLPSPGLADFSARGPSTSNGGILKPDILAPGVNVLAAWPFPVGPFGGDSAKASFNFMSGTSVAAPHIAGIAAIIKSKFPKWSAAAVLSAIVTSGCSKDETGNGTIVDESSSTNATASGFGEGGGVVNATGALDPGLLYETDHCKYADYLCGLGYSDKEIKATWGMKVKCSKAAKGGNATELNYPSIAWHSTKGSIRKTVTRTVKNVGESQCVYKANVTAPAGVKVRVSKSELKFTSKFQKLSFKVSMSIDPSVVKGSATLTGELKWVSEKRVVKSPIAIMYRPPWKEGGSDRIADV